MARFPDGYVTGPKEKINSDIVAPDRRWTMLQALFLLALVGTAAACRNNPSTESDVEFPGALSKAEDGRPGMDPPLAGRIAIDGSSTVFPITSIMASEFMKTHPRVKIAVGISRTGGGFRKFCAGETDLTGASRPINVKEIELCDSHGIAYIELPIAFDSLSVVVHPHNTSVDCLTVPELKKMWEPAAQRAVTRWSQIRPTFPNQPLVLYGPGRDSGTFDFFTLAIVGEESKSRADYKASRDDAVVIDGVASHVHGLGYFGYAYYLANRTRLKTVAVDNGYGCVQPSPQTVADSTYQPLSRPVFIYVKESAAARPEVKAFIDFYLLPANAGLLLQVGNVPLPTITLRAARSRFHSGLTGTVFGGSGSVFGGAQPGLEKRAH
jgi:phosphate transport system substrate-binding protein